MRGSLHSFILCKNIVKIVIRKYTVKRQPISQGTNFFKPNLYEPEGNLREDHTSSCSHPDETGGQLMTG